MKDTYFSDDLAQDWTPPMMQRTKGFGHGIRPRGDLHKSTQSSGAEAPAQRAAAAPIAQPQPSPKVTARVTPRRPVKAAVKPAAKRPLRQPEQPARQQEAPVLDIPRWHDLAFATAAKKRDAAAAGPVQDAAEDTASTRAFDLLRTKLRQVAKENGWTNIGITAPTPGCGTTFMATNLARSLSRIGASRTILMDMNLRRPGVAAALDLQAPGDIRSYLNGQVGLLDQVARESETLAVVLNDQKEENAAEVLQDRRTRHTLEQMRSALRPDMVIYDLPAMLTFDDVSAFLPQLDALLMISDGTRTSAQQLAECERLMDGNVPLLGVALNNARRKASGE